MLLLVCLLLLLLGYNQRGLDTANPGMCTAVLVVYFDLASAGNVFIVAASNQLPLG